MKSSLMKHKLQLIIMNHLNQCRQEVLQDLQFRSLLTVKNFKVFLFVMSIKTVLWGATGKVIHVKYTCQVSTLKS